MKLAWNAIVRNEAKVIDRCVKSLLPHVDCAIVVDTGSSDGTPDLIKAMFAAAGKPVELHTASFVNFAYARNAALRAARDSKLSWDYLLLVDADMELKVHRPDWVNGADGLSYDMRQTAGSVAYFNRRLVSRKATGQYIGVTHEYLDIASAGTLDGAEFVDHADGANRPDKFARDIALLEEALKIEVRPGIIERYHFYLAQSYFDAGNWSKAAEHYAKRVQLGGYEEERWNAQLHLAHCYANMGDQPKFVWAMLQAYQMRPHRAEALYDLAKHFREKGDNFISLLFSDTGTRISDPKNDLLFVNEYVFHTGLREEFSICAYYDDVRRQRGAKVCNDLALCLKGTDQSRNQARNNQYWYLKPLATYIPSFQPIRIEVEPPDGFVATNPSITNFQGEPVAIVRMVNYTITPEGQYAIRGFGGTCNSSNPIHTRNYLVKFNSNFTINPLFTEALGLPENWPVPSFDLVIGFEDSRLFSWDERLWTLSTVRELTPEGWCEQVLAPIRNSAYGDNWVRVLPAERRHEKNWMPWVKPQGHLHYVYRLGILLDTDGRELVRHENKYAIDHISGGSQVVNVEGSYIALVHEARTIPGRVNRYYQHRFVLLSELGWVVSISPPFVFHDRQVEFAAGLAYFPEWRKLVASYGVRDCEAWLATMDVDEVFAFLER